MSNQKERQVAKNLVFGLALAAMVFIVVVGLLNDAVLAANILLGLFFIGWVPAALVLSQSPSQASPALSRRDSQIKLAVVLGAAVLAVAALVTVVPLVTYPLSPLTSIAVLVLGFVPTSALALVHSSSRK